MASRFSNSCKGNVFYISSRVYEMLNVEVSVFLLEQRMEYTFQSQIFIFTQDFSTLIFLFKSVYPVHWGNRKGKGLIPLALTDRWGDKTGK